MQTPATNLVATEPGHEGMPNVLYAGGIGKTHAGFIVIDYSVAPEGFVYAKPNDRTVWFSPRKGGAQIDALPVTGARAKLVHGQPVTFTVEWGGPSNNFPVARITA